MINLYEWDMLSDMGLQQKGLDQSNEYYEDDPIANLIQTNVVVGADGGKEC